jgi:hypothetical protein
MGLRDRMEAGAARLGGAARDATREAASAGLRRAPDEGFRSFRELFDDDDERPVRIERFMLALVATVRGDEIEKDRDARDVFETARRRRRGLGFVSFGTGPLVRVSNQVADLYCDTATVCDLAEVHRLGLDDEQIAAHMLVLWGVADSFADATGAMNDATGLSIAGLLHRRLVLGAGGDYDGDATPEKMSKLEAVKALWNARDALGDARDDARKGALSTIVFTGKHTKELIERAEFQLGVTGT